MKEIYTVQDYNIDTGMPFDFADEDEAKFRGVNVSGVHYIVMQSELEGTEQPLISTVFQVTNYDRNTGDASVKRITDPALVLKVGLAYDKLLEDSINETFLENTDLDYVRFDSI